MSAGSAARAGAPAAALSSSAASASLRHIMG
jgi:hypothetical protein